MDIMRASDKYVKLREKVREQATAFIEKYVEGNNYPVPPYLTTNLLLSSDMFQKKEWKISHTTDTTWRSYQGEVKEMRNNVLPLWDSVVKLSERSANGSVKIPSGKSLEELLDKLLLALHLSDVQRKTKSIIIDDDSSSESASTLGTDVNANEVVDSEEEVLESVNSVHAGYVFKLILVFALTGPLAEFPANYSKICDGNDTFEKKNFIKTEMSRTGLQAAASVDREEIGAVSEVKAEKKQKYEKIASEKN